MNVKVKTRAINSKRLFNEIDELVHEGLQTVDIAWEIDDEREIFLDFLNSMLQEFWSKGEIEQWKVQCNSLNNKTDDMLNGIVNLDIYYKQKHCLNTSRITYTFQE